MSDRSIEEVIRRAIQEGKFDDLPGKGKPLQLDQNPHVDPEWRAAHQILISGGFTLSWIESLREIENNLQSARTGLVRTWEWYQMEHDQKIESRQPNNDWPRAVEKFRNLIASINNDIRSYNLEVPNDHFQLQLINVEKEIDRIKASSD